MTAASTEPHRPSLDKPIPTGEPSAQGSVCKFQSSAHLAPSQPPAPKTEPNLPEHKGLAGKDNRQEPVPLGAQRGQQ